MDSALSLDTPSVVCGRELSESSSYHFLANIASADLDRARQAARLVWPAGEFRLVPIICSDLGLPLKGAALYVLDRLSESASFWRLFDSLAPRSAA
jgi:hypothetical protein